MTGVHFRWFDKYFWKFVDAEIASQDAQEARKAERKAAGIEPKRRRGRAE